MSTEYDVILYLYDISHGMAKAMARPILGKDLEGIWHTGIVAYGYEFFYGGGIQYARPGMTQAGQPMRVIPLGRTKKTQREFHEFLQSINPEYTPDKYDLMDHNCNNFSSDCARFLQSGFDIPRYILDLPNEVQSTPLGQMFKPMFSQMRGPSGAPVYAVSLPLISNEGVSNGSVKYGEHSMYHNVVQQHQQQEEQQQQQQHQQQTSPISTAVSSASSSASSYTTPSNTFTIHYLPEIPAFHKPNHTLALITALQRKDTLAAPLVAVSVELKELVALLPSGRVLPDASQLSVLRALLTVVADEKTVGIVLLPLLNLLSWVQMVTPTEITDTMTSQNQDMSSGVSAVQIRLIGLLEAIARKESLQMTSASTTEMLSNAVFGAWAVFATRFPFVLNDVQRTKALIQQDVLGVVAAAAHTCGLGCSLAWTAVSTTLYACKVVELMQSVGAETTDTTMLETLTKDSPAAGMDLSDSVGEAAMELLILTVDKLEAADKAAVCAELYHVLGLIVAGSEVRKSIQSDIYMFSGKNPHESAIQALLE